MKTLYNCGNYGNELRITKKDAIFCSGSGDMERNVLSIMKKTYLKKQLKTFNHESLAKDLKEYGAWDENELKNHEQNLIRWVWISCCNISEELNA